MLLSLQPNPLPKHHQTPTSTHPKLKHRNLYLSTFASHTHDNSNLKKYRLREESRQVGEGNSSILAPPPNSYRVRKTPTIYEQTKTF